MNRVEKAAEYHKRGFNCAQAVSCAFADLINVDEETLFKATEGLGLGIGGMQGTCGAITGAAAVLGFLNSTGDLNNPNSKADTYKLSRQLVDEFYRKNGAIICKELKGVETKKVLRSCPGCIDDAVEILEKIIAQRDA